MTQYTEIFKLKQMLEDCEIPFFFCDFTEIFMGYQILLMRTDTEFMDYGIVLNPCSYGLDVMESSTVVDGDYIYDSVGYLTVEEVFNRIKAHYERRNQ